MGEAHQPGLVVARVGEGAPPVPEKLVLGQCIGQRAAVYRHERAVVPHAVVVNSTGGQLLARAGLALEEDRGVERRNALDERDKCQKHRRLSYHELFSGCADAGRHGEAQGAARHTPDAVTLETPDFVGSITVPTACTRGYLDER